MSLIRRNDFIIPTLAVVFDSIAIEFSFLFSYWLRFKTDVLNFLPLTEDKPPLEAYILGSLVVIPVWLLIFNSRKMYGARRNVNLSDDFFSIIKAVTLGMLIVMSAAFFYRAFSYSRIVFGLIWIVSILTITSGRIILLQIEKMLYKKGRELRNAVIIGNNRTADKIFNSFYKHPLLGYRLVGYYANEPAEKSYDISNLKYLGNLSDVPDNIVKENIELVLIALSYDEHMSLYKLVQECEGVNVDFMMVPDLLEIMTGGMKIKEIEGIPFIKIKSIPMTTWGRIFKRTFDIIISAMLLLLLLPLFLFIMILIKFSSKGPVFFIQDRIGLDGQNFKMIKFRSMVVGAEKYDEEAGLGIQNDPRQTKIGKLLRRTSLDELPQLLNVLKGEMSLVGPRPERPYFVEQFKNLVPKYLDRHRVKTGMTGWAQVNGFRGDSSLEERIKYDIYYIENWSLWFDIKILLKTIKAIF